MIFHSVISVNIHKFRYVISKAGRIFLLCMISQNTQSCSTSGRKFTRAIPTSIPLTYYTKHLVQWKNSLAFLDTRICICRHQPDVLKIANATIMTKPYAS